MRQRQRHWPCAGIDHPAEQRGEFGPGFGDQRDPVPRRPGQQVAEQQRAAAEAHERRVQAAAAGLGAWAGEELGWLAVSVARQIGMEQDAVEIIQAGISSLPIDGVEFLPLAIAGRQPLDLADLPGQALAFAREVERRAPEDVTTTWWRKDRDPAALFVDYNQNARDHTIAAAYSVRGVPEARVSAPIRWDEVDDCVPDDFTIFTMPERYAQIHRSVIVNLSRVSHVSRGLNETADVHLNGRSETLPVSRSFLHLFRQM